MIIIKIKKVIDEIKEDITDNKRRWNKNDKKQDKCDFVGLIKAGINMSKGIDKDSSDYANYSSECIFKYYEKLEDGSYKIYNIDQKKFRKKMSELILVCPYCGKSGFIKTKGKSDNDIYSFELDHFLPWSKFKQFATNVYNLIPVCKVCNQVLKKDYYYEKGIYFHPYLGAIEFNGTFFKLKEANQSFDDIFKFGLDIKSLSFDTIKDYWKFKDESTNKLYNKHIEYFRLNDVYRYSPCTKSDYGMFLNIRNVFLSGKNNGKESGIYKIDDLFKNRYPENKSDVLKFTNGKMKRDLIERLKNE